MRRTRTEPGSLPPSAALLLTALALSSAVGCRRASAPAQKSAPAAATVNGVAIPVTRVQSELDRLRRGSGADAGPGAEGEGPLQADPKETPRLARALLDAMIDRTLVLERARAAGIRISDADVQRATDELAASVRAGGEPFAQRLQRDGQTMERLSDETRDQLLAARYVTDQTSRERASPAEARAWFEQHKAEFERPDMTHCQQLVVRTPEQAKTLLDQLRRGAAFDELARAHGTSPDARAGGDLGWFARGTMPKQFDDICFSLAPGKLSGVVASPYGYHVFKVLGRRAARKRTFDEVRLEAERRATDEKRADAERQLMSQLRSQAEVRVDEAALALVR